MIEPGTVVGVWMSKDLEKELKDLAKKDERSLSSYIRIVLKNHASTK